MSIEAMKLARKYTKPGAIVPVDVDTTRLLVEALRAAIEQVEKQEPINYEDWKFNPMTGELLWDEKQEPVAWQDTAKHSELVAAEDWDNIDPQWHFMYRPLYTAPPQREWQGLTDKFYEQLAEKHVTNCYFDTLTYAKAIEQALKEKNT